ncbi:BRI1 kinase inhibitor 1 [Actinidia rufa]|uniref:BRI1 kinase inhibitor 1 n=1 Tax=Actinidia rufa TaxID=165716 RepID=A0A7J0EK75_9ERIC|nr:BRI1 kinase inhibitor 1 [Actinidia rufa]
MESPHHHKMRDKVEDDHKNNQTKEEAQQSNQQQQQLVQSTAASPPSASSSPAHEFSFTISLHHQPPYTAAATKPPPPSSAVDLSPADEIFFHGHLLPLHLLSHLPVSPRSSTNSLDSFTLPIRELHDPSPSANKNTPHSEIIERPRPNPDPKPKPKAKSFSFLSRWRKGTDSAEEREKEEREKRRFDVSHVLKRYMRMIRPLFGRRENPHLRRKPYSFSGYLTPRSKQEGRGGKRGEFSAPASMRTSPTNSGLLVPAPASDSTMEELQAAIQAAIAHCKNSIAMEEKIKC